MVLRIKQPPSSFTRWAKPVGSLLGTDRRDDDQPVGDLGGRVFDPLPLRGLPGSGQQLGMPQGGPARQQALGVVPFVIGREILQAMAGQQD